MGRERSRMMEEEEMGRGKRKWKMQKEEDGEEKEG